MNSSEVNIKREAIFSSYVTNMITYLKKNNPSINLKDHELKQFLMDYVNNNAKRPTVDVVAHKQYGDAELRTYDLLKYSKLIRGKVISPSGSVYKTSREHSSFLRKKIIQDKAGRKDHKNLMFEAKAAGDLAKANYHNVMQALLKIFMNSIIGAMGSKFSFLSDITGFNSVTSLARYFIMNSYAQTERMLCGNFYFPTKEHVINHIVMVLRICPTENTINKIMTKYGLYCPDWDDVYDFLNSNYKKYNLENLNINISNMLFNMPKHELIFLFYFNNLKNIFEANSDRYKTWVRDFYNEDILNDKDNIEKLDPKGIFSLDKDLVTLISTVHGNKLPLVGDKKVSIWDTARVPEYNYLAKDFLCIGNKMQSKIDIEFKEIFDLFFDTPTIVPNTIEHKNMFRECVILSDTDSVVFTTKWWIMWYTGDTRITPDAYRINSLAVYFLTKAMVYLMRNISVHKGALDEDVYGMKMKNEFFYPVMIQSSLKKHYAGLVAVQEGVVLPKLNPDIKGLNYKPSSLSDVTRKFIRDFIIETITAIINNGKISAKERIWKIVSFEKQIFDSIKKGELTYLSINPIKSANEYKDEEKSIYFNYLFWEEVFASKYGSIKIPTKCYTIPLTGVKDKKYIEYLEKTDKTLYCNLLAFYEKYPNKDITRIPINPIIDTVPMELLPIMNIRHIVYENAAPLALFMKSVGVTLGNKSKSKILFSDMYGYELR